MKTLGISALMALVLSVSATATTFEDWCRNNTLNCSHQYQSRNGFWLPALAWLRAFGESSGSFELTSGDLDSEHLTRIFHLLEEPILLKKIREITHSTGFEGLYLIPGGLQFRHQPPVISAIGTSNIRWTSFQPTFKIKGSKLEIEGLHSSVSGDLKAIDLDTQNAFRASFFDASVRGVPSEFIASEIQWTGVPAFGSTPFDKSRIPALMIALKNWFFRDQRTWTMEKDLLAATADLTARLTKDSTLKRITTQFLPLLDSIHLQNESPSLSARTLGDGGLQCTISGVGPTISLSFLPKFSIIEAVETSPSQIDFLLKGIRARIELPGPFDPNFDIADVRVDSQGLTIRSVPVLGQLNIPFAERDQNAAVSCLRKNS